MTRLAAVLMVVVVPVIVLAQPATKPPQTQAPAKPPEQTPATFPKGTYSVTMQDGSAIEVTFGDGTYVATTEGQHIADGKYSTKGNQIVVSDNSDACANTGEGVYTWAFDGKALTFKGTQDACSDRLGIMTGYAFIRK